MSIGKNTRKPVAAASAIPRAIDSAKSGMESSQVLRLGLRLRCVVVGAIAPLGHELVKLGPVFGEAQPFQELFELALFFLEPSQRIGAIFVESSIVA
jgi:hypothetical protein